MEPTSPNPQGQPTVALPPAGSGKMVFTLTAPPASPAAEPAEPSTIYLQPGQIINVVSPSGTSLVLNSAQISTRHIPPAPATPVETPFPPSAASSSGGQASSSSAAHPSPHSAASSSPATKKARFSHSTEPVSTELPIFDFDPKVNINDERFMIKPQICDKTGELLFELYRVRKDEQGNYWALSINKQQKFEHVFDMPIDETRCFSFDSEPESRIKWVKDALREENLKSLPHHFKQQVAAFLIHLENENKAKYTLDRIQTSFKLSLKTDLTSKNGTHGLSIVDLLSMHQDAARNWDTAFSSQKWFFNETNTPTVLATNSQDIVISAPNCGFLREADAKIPVQGTAVKFIECLDILTHEGKN